MWPQRWAGFGKDRGDPGGTVLLQGVVDSIKTETLGCWLTALCLPSLRGIPPALTHSWLPSFLQNTVPRLVYILPPASTPSQLLEPVPAAGRTQRDGTWGWETTISTPRPAHPPLALILEQIPSLEQNCSQSCSFEEAVAKPPGHAAGWGLLVGIPRLREEGALGCGGGALPLSRVPEADRNGPEPPASLHHLLHSPQPWLVGDK